MTCSAQLSLENYVFDVGKPRYFKFLGIKGFEIECIYMHTLFTIFQIVFL